MGRECERAPLSDVDLAGGAGSHTRACALQVLGEQLGAVVDTKLSHVTDAHALAHAAREGALATWRLHPQGEGALPVQLGELALDGGGERLESGVLAHLVPSGERGGEAEQPRAVTWLWPLFERVDDGVGELRSVSALSHEGGGSLSVGFGRGAESFCKVRFRNVPSTRSRTRERSEDAAPHHANSPGRRNSHLTESVQTELLSRALVSFLS